MEGTDSGNKSNGTQEKLANPLTDWQDAPIKPVEPINANFSDDEVKGYKYLARAQLFNKVQKVLLPFFIVGVILLLISNVGGLYLYYKTIRNVGYVCALPFVLAEMIFAFKMAKYRKIERWFTAFLILGIILILIYMSSFFAGGSFALLCWRFGVALCVISSIGIALVVRSCGKVAKSSAVCCIAKEVLSNECKSSGKEGKKNLSKELKELSKKKQTQAFNAKLEEAHNRYIQWDIDRQIAENNRVKCIQEGKPVNGQGTALPLEYEGEGTFDGWLIQKIGWNLLCSLVTLITLGIAYPFTICWKQRWLCKHTVYKGQRLSFDGNGLQLLGKWICWLLLSIVTLTIYAWFLPIRVAKWKAKHTHIAGENKELGGTFDGWLIQSIGWSLLCSLVTLITLGIAYPFTVCWKLQWEAKHTVYDGRRLKFDGNGLQILGKWICWLLLSIVTLTIYAWFIPIRMEKWKAKHMQLLPVEQINEQLNY